MEAKELRIGNLVYLNGQPSAVTIGFLQYLTGVLIKQKGGEEEWYYNNLFKDHGPIPLTEESLLKLGFELEESLVNDFIFTHKNIELWQATDGFMLLNGEGRTNWMKEYKFVHELQNVVYDLTDEELTFKNTGF